MFSGFLSAYRPDCAPTGELKGSALQDVRPPGLRELLTQFSGVSFNRSLYRVHRGDSVEKWSAIVCDALPLLANRVTCFAYDWLGRHFGLDPDRLERGEPLVLMLEPGTGEALEIPATLADFHNDVLVNLSDAALASNFYSEWLAAGGAIPDSNQCIGYKVPLFLGGDDTVANLEAINLEIYWTICGQLIKGTRKLPPGTRIKDISIR